MRTIIAAVLLYAGAILPSYAVDLMDIYHQALDNDPQFKNAWDSYQANKEFIPIARSVLYPQVSASLQTARNTLDVIVGSGLRTRGTFNNYQWSISASQVIFNYQGWASVKQAKASVKAAHAQFNDSAQNLILRTADQYFQVLLASDTLAFAEAKKRANKRQLEQAEQRFKVGLDAITSVYEAKAAYDQSIAQVIQASNNQINQNENLRKLTNHVYQGLAPLRHSRIPLIRPEPDNVDEWVDVGLRQNYLLNAAIYNLQASRENISVQNAGHLPTVSIQSNALDQRNLANQRGSVFAPLKNLNANVALVISVPIFQGGLVEANTRQATYTFQSVSEQLEQVRREVIVNSRIAFNTIIDGISKVKADRQTVISQRQSLESTEAQFEVGTRTMVDVVNAQQRLFDAQRQLATDQYGFIMAILQLKYLAGTVSGNDLEEVNSWLETTRISSFAPINNSTRRA